MYENYEGNHEIPVNKIKEQRERNPVALKKDLIMSTQVLFSLIS